MRRTLHHPCSCGRPRCVRLLCPFIDSKGPELNAKGPELSAGSLAGTVVMCFLCFVFFITALVLGRGYLRRSAAVAFLLLYVLYAAYEVVAAYELPVAGRKMIVCVLGLCL